VKAFGISAHMASSVWYIALKLPREVHLTQPLQMFFSICEER